MKLINSSFHSKFKVGKLVTLDSISDSIHLEIRGIGDHMAGQKRCFKIVSENAQPAPFSKDAPGWGYAKGIWINIEKKIEKNTSVIRNLVHKKKKI